MLHQKLDMVLVSFELAASDGRHCPEVLQVLR